MSNELQTQGNYKDRLIALCDRITDFFDWSMEREQKEWEETGSRRITTTEDLRKTVYKAKLEANLNHGLGITGLYERIPTPDRWGSGWVDMLGYDRVEHFNPEYIEKQRLFAYIVMDIIQLYNDWKTNEFNPMVAGLTSQLKAGDVEIDPAVLEAVNKLVVDGKFTAYKYKDGGDSIGINDEYHISSVIGFSQDLTMWLTHIQNQQEFLSKQAENKVFITMFGKLDEVHPIYSNWLFTLHKGKTIWIVTDQIDFDNPYQKRARLERRSVWRDADEHYAECDLPFNLFHEMEELRGSNDKLAKNDSFIREKFVDFKATIDKKYSSTFDRRDHLDKITKMMEDLFKKKLEKLGIEFDFIKTEYEDASFGAEYVEAMYARRDGHTVAYAHTGEIIVYKYAEVFFKAFSELKSGQQTFAVLLMKEMIQYLGSNVELETIMLASEHTNMKLLEGAQIDPVAPTHMEYWTPEHKQIFNELLETLEDGEEKTTALALRTYDIVRKSTHYNASWLTTQNKLESLAEWTILEDEKNKLYSKIHELSQMKDEAFKWLEKQFAKNYDAIAERMMLAKEITFIGSRNVRNGFTTEMEEAECGSVFEMLDKKGVYSKRGSGIGKTQFKEEDCFECRKSKTRLVAAPNQSRIVKRIEIRHYKELMWLLGYTDRKQLHKYFRQFRAHDLIPYNGNSLLDQTHPYLRINDPCSRYKTNGMSFDFFMCKTCYNKIKQQDKLEIKWAEDTKSAQ